MHGDGAHLRAQVPLQIGGGHRGQHRAVALAGQYDAPLQVPRLRARDWRSRRVAVRCGPGAPGVVGRFGVAGPCEQLDLAAGRRGSVPADRPPRRDHLRIVHLGLIGAARRALGRDAEQLARVRGGVIETAGRVLVEGRHLLRCRAGEQRRSNRIALEPVQLALAAGADDQRAVAIERQVVGRVFLRLPQLIPDAVRRDPVDRALGRAAILARRGLRSGSAGVDDRHRRDLRGHRRDRRAHHLAAGHPVGAAVGHDRRGTGRLAAADRGDVERALVVEPERVDFLERRVEQHERLAVGIDPQHLAWRPGAGEQVAVLVEHQRRDVRGVGLVEDRGFAVRRDLVDDALVAGPGVDVALAVHRERPDVLVFAVEERRRGPVALDPVDLAVGGGADVQAAVGRQRQRVGFQFRAVEEQRALALRVDPKHLALVARADEQRAVGRRHHRPEERRRGLVHQLGDRAERQLSVVVDREVLDVAFQEVVLCRGLKELRGGSVKGNQRGGDEGRRQQRSETDMHQF